jgi:hypothetical protein
MFTASADARADSDCKRATDSPATFAATPRKIQGICVFLRSDPNHITNFGAETSIGQSVQNSVAEMGAIFDTEASAALLFLRCNFAREIRSQATASAYTFSWPKVAH